MITESARRVLKNRFGRTSNRLSPKGIFLSLAVISTFLFCLVQLAVNANLNPKGELLESLNREKTALVEENRQIEQEIAQAESLSIVSDIAKNKLSLKDNASDSIIYVSDSSIVAEK